MSAIVHILMNDVLDYRKVKLEFGAWEHDWEPTRSMGGPGLTAAACQRAGDTECEGEPSQPHLS